MIKILINVKKLDLTRTRKGTKNPDNEYITLLVSKSQFPDTEGNQYSVMHAQTLAERKANEKKLYVGKGRALSLAVAEEDPERFLMLHVEGGGAPTKRHANLGIALHEGHRLNNITGQDVYILEVVGVIPKKPGQDIPVPLNVEQTLTAAPSIEPEEEPKKKQRKRIPKK